LGRFDDAPNVQGAKDSLAGTITDPRAVSLLVATLGTENPCVRRVAAKLLGRSVVTAAVLRGLLDNPAPRIRESAAFAAGVGERRETRAALEHQLADTATGPAAMAAWALGELKDRTAAVRRAAVRALADLHERSAVAPLEGLLRNDPDREVQRECARALGELHAASSLDALARALADPDVLVQREAANALGELEDLTKAPAALVRATTSPDVDLRRHATKSLAKIGDLATVQALADRLGDEDKDIRLAAVEGLGEMKVEAAIPGLTRALNDRDPEVRRAAAEALGKTQE